MVCVWLGLAAIWLGGSLGLILGGLLAGAKRRDVDAAYEQLSTAIHQYMADCARQDLSHPCLPERLMVLRRVVTDADLLAGLACDEADAVAKTSASESQKTRCEVR